MEKTRGKYLGHLTTLDGLIKNHGGTYLEGIKKFPDKVLFFRCKFLLNPVVHYFIPIPSANFFVISLQFSVL